MLRERGAARLVHPAGFIPAGFIPQGALETIAWREGQLLERGRRMKLDDVADLVHVVADLLAVEIDPPGRAEEAVAGDPPRPAIGTLIDSRGERAVRRDIHAVERVRRGARAGPGIADHLGGYLRRVEARPEREGRLRAERRRRRAAREREASGQQDSQSHGRVSRLLVSRIVDERNPSTMLRS